MRPGVESHAFVSRQIMAVLETLLPRVEKVSIDEANLARGIADDQVYPASERKSLSKETTFDEDATDPAILKDTPRWAAQEVSYLACHEQRKGLVVT